MGTTALNEKATPEPPDAASLPRLQPSTNYHSLRLDEIESENYTLATTRNALWPLADHDALVRKIISDIEAAMVIRAGAAIAIEGEMQL